MKNQKKEMEAKKRRAEEMALAVWEELQAEAEARAQEAATVTASNA